MGLDVDIDQQGKYNTDEIKASYLRGYKITPCSPLKNKSTPNYQNDPQDSKKPFWQTRLGHNLILASVPTTIAAVIGLIGTVVAELIKKPREPQKTSSTVFIVTDKEKAKLAGFQAENVHVVQNKLPLANDDEETIKTPFPEQ